MPIDCSTHKRYPKNLIAEHTNSTQLIEYHLFFSAQNFSTVSKPKQMPVPAADAPTLPTVLSTVLMNYFFYVRCIGTRAHRPELTTQPHTYAWTRLHCKAGAIIGAKRLHDSAMRNPFVFDHTSRWMANLALVVVLGGGPDARR